MKRAKILHLYEFTVIDVIFLLISSIMKWYVKDLLGRSALRLSFVSLSICMSTATTVNLRAGISQLSNLSTCANCKIQKHSSP